MQKQKQKTYSKYLIAWVVSLGLFMAVLDTTVINVSLSAMQNQLGVTLSDIQWVITGYLLAQAAALPVAGYLGVRFGLKRMYLLFLALFIFGSALCAFAPDETWLIAFRVLQGIGGGGLFPLVLNIALRSFEPRERASASAIVGVAALVAPALGPTAGGWLTDTFGWPSIFLINVPVGIVAIVLATQVVPTDDSPEKSSSSSFDAPGLILSILGVVGVVYAFNLVSQVQPGTITLASPRGLINGWGYWPVWALLGASLLILVLLAFYELRVSQDPALDLRLFKIYSFTVPVLINWLVAAAIFGSFFVLPLFLESLHQPHQSATDAGLLLFPQGLASAVAVLLSGRILYDRIGARNLVVFGALLLVIGSFGFTMLTPDEDNLQIIGWSIVRGLGFGLTFIPVQTRALQEITGPALAKANTLIIVGRQIFSSVGTTTASVLFTQQSAQHATELTKTALEGGVLLNPQQILIQAGTMGINDVFLAVTIGSVIILVASIFIPGKLTFSEQVVKQNQTSADG